MLIKASFSNFKSFEDETTLTMISSNKTTKKQDHKVSFMSSTNILKYGIVYGANASGKSNLIEVFRFIKYCISTAIPAEASTFFCKSKKENINKPSVFELQFTVGKKIYAYGFQLLLSKQIIEAEWLYELHQNNSVDTIFEWQRNTKPIIGESFRLNTDEQNRINTYINDFDNESNFLFLSVMNRNKKYETNSKLYVFKKVYEYLLNNITVCSPNVAITDFNQYYDSASLSQISKLIKSFDTGITDIEIVDTTFDELSKVVPEFFYKNIIAQMNHQIEQLQEGTIRFSWRSNRDFYNIKVTKGEEPSVSTLRIKHGPSYYPFNYGDESDGTQRLFELIDMVLNKDNDRIYVIDEMERSLHPKLTAHFIELFNEAHKNDQVQLIFTTHESSIMDQDLFRRDEIWFVERNSENVSQLFSLDLFKVRYDTKLSKAYLEGRYGAIPVFSEFKFKEEQ